MLVAKTIYLWNSRSYSLAFFYSISTKISVIKMHLSRSCCIQTHDRLRAQPTNEMHSNTWQKPYHWSQTSGKSSTIESCAPTYTDAHVHAYVHVSLPIFCGVYVRISSCLVWCACKPTNSWQSLRSCHSFRLFFFQQLVELLQEKVSILKLKKVLLAKQTGQNSNKINCKMSTPKSAKDDRVYENSNMVRKSHFSCVFI